MDKVFIDTDIILDLLLQRKGFFAEASRLFASIEKGEIHGFASPLILANIYYILKKLLGAKSAKESILRLKMLLKILTIDEKIIELALSSAFNDFEDAIQYYSAVENNLDCLVTRNKRDYKASYIPIYTPKEFFDIRKD
jgi:predicted nucleic acid-binding protein